MPQFAITETSRGDERTGEALGCSLCGSVEGPFVAVSEALFKVNTASGPVVADRPLQLCAPKRDGDVTVRQGCAGSIALLCGYTDPDEIRAVHEELDAAIAESAELAGQVAELSASQIKVVPIEQFLELVASTTKA